MGILREPGKVITPNNMTKLLKKRQHGEIAQLSLVDVQASSPSISLDLKKVINNH